jgi:pyridoxine 5-phosphate synthase
VRLYINIDHVATVRQARRTDEPDPVRAAVLAELGGADGITVHLREDRRHIQDRDVELLLRTARTGINFEMAGTEEMTELALAWRPMQVTLVPERREEVTTEGGLAISSATRSSLSRTIRRLVDGGLRTALFIDPDADVVRASADLGVQAVELHTGEYAHSSDDAGRAAQLARLQRASALGRSIGLDVHAGHGLTYLNAGPVAAITEIEELNIGHSVISHSVFVGLERAVREMKQIVLDARKAG